MKVVLTIDSYKGSLTSAEAEQTVREAILQRYPDWEVDCIPTADGGEGTLSVILGHLQGHTRTVVAHNPCMERIAAPYGVSRDGQTAVIEMAAVSGLPLLREEQRNPMETTTYGIGELIKDALENGCRQFLIGIGGSATNDAGTGMLQALGYRFYDRNGNELGQGGKILNDIARVEADERHPLLEKARFVVACDVQNPLYGPHGAARIYARQKGADDRMIAELDRGMESFARVMQEATGKDVADLPGSGAAGGLGGCLAAFLNAELKSGADLLLELCQFTERTADADLLITGEGKADRQSLMGKITGKVLQGGREQGIPVIIIAGSAEDQEALLEAGFQAVYTTLPEGMSLEEAMRSETAKENLRKAVGKMLEDLPKSTVRHP